MPLARLQVPVDQVRQGVEKTGPLVECGRLPEFGDSHPMCHLSVLPVQLRKRLDVIAGECDRYDQYLLPLAPKRRITRSVLGPSQRTGPTSD